MKRKADAPSALSHLRLPRPIGARSTPGQLRRLWCSRLNDIIGEGPPTPGVAKQLRQIPRMKRLFGPLSLLLSFKVFNGCFSNLKILRTFFPLHVVGLTKSLTQGLLWPFDGDFPKYRYCVQTISTDANLEDYWGLFDGNQEYDWSRIGLQPSTEKALMYFRYNYHFPVS